MTYTKLWLSVLTKEQHDRTCGYWFTVTNGGTPHTAFRTISGLLTWMMERGLKQSAPITAPGTQSWQLLDGSYSEEAHMSKEVFNSLVPIIETRTLSNGDYTLAKITEKDGHRTVHTLNPNVHDRVVFDYPESRAIYN